MPKLLTDLPEWSTTLRLVIDCYGRALEIPGREQLRTGAMLRAHARAVLRRLARGCAAAHEVDRCSELEYAEAHCARIDYLCTLIASLKWRPRLEMELLRSRWLSLRGRLARAREQLVQGMTWRSGDKPEPMLVPQITRSLPAMLPAPRKPDSQPVERVPERSEAEVEVPDTQRVGPSFRLAPPEGTEVDCWVEELGSWFDADPSADPNADPERSSASFTPPVAPAGRSTVRRRPPPTAPSPHQTLDFAPSPKE